MTIYWKTIARLNSPHPALPLTHPLRLAQLGTPSDVQETALSAIVTPKANKGMPSLTDRSLSLVMCVHPKMRETCAEYEKLPVFPPKPYILWGHCILKAFHGLCRSLILFALINLLSMPVWADTGLEFPRNDQVPDGQTVRFKFTNPHQNGLPIYGPGGAGITYIFKVRPKQHTGYYTTFFWGNDDGGGTLDTFTWHNGSADTYYGMHPYPQDPTGSNGTAHNWEISVDTFDIQNGLVVKNAWYTQVARVWSDGNGKHHEFYWDWPKTDTAHKVTWNSPPVNNNVNPPSPALTFGDAPWQPGQELCSCTLRGIQIYSDLLSLADVQSEIAAPQSTAAGIASIWYMNINPTPTDISDKSGAGHNPSWVGSNRATLYSDGGNDSTPPAAPTNLRIQ